MPYICLEPNKQCGIEASVGHEVIYKSMSVNSSAFKREQPTFIELWKLISKKAGKAISYPNSQTANQLTVIWPSVLILELFRSGTVPDVPRWGGSCLSRDTGGLGQTDGDKWREGKDVKWRNYSQTLQAKETLKEFTGQYFECRVQTELLTWQG